MSLPPQSRSLGDLDFNRIWSTNAERDRNTTLAVSVYNGKTSFVIFSGQGGPPKAKLGLPRQYNVLFRRVFDHLRKSGPDNKITIPVLDWDQVAKKMVPNASVTFGLDASNQPYIGISVIGGLEPTKFPVRNDLKWDISTIAELNGPSIAIDSFLAALDNSVQAATLTNFKFDPGQRGGGGGGGGGRPSYGGGGGRQSMPSSAPASDDISDEIPF